MAGGTAGLPGAARFVSVTDYGLGNGMTTAGLPGTEGVNRPFILGAV